MTYAIIAADIMGFTICLVMLYVNTFKVNVKSRRARCFDACVVVSALAILTDFLAYILPGSDAWMKLRIVFMTLSFSMIFLVQALFFQYLYYLFYLKNKIFSTHMRVLSYLCCLAMLITMIFCGLGKIFLFINGNYILKNGYILYLVMVLVIYLLEVLFILISEMEKKLKIWDFVSIISFLLLPVISMSISVHLVGQNVVYPALTIALLIVDVMLHSEYMNLMEQELKDAKVRAMLSQIQPHFLYNTLNSVVNLCYKDGEEAAEALVDFSDYLRGNLELGDTETVVPFDVELEHLKNYLRLEKLRMGERLNIIIDTPETDFYLPPLTIQPLVGNAIKHGVSQLVNGGTIKISTHRVKNHIYVCVEDDGGGFDLTKLEEDGTYVDEEGGKHFGLKNVIYRLEICSQAKLSIETKTGEGTRVIVRIPVNNRMQGGTG